MTTLTKHNNHHQMTLYFKTLQKKMHFRGASLLISRSTGHLKRYLKVPKRENFSLAFFALSKPIWVCDRVWEKNRFFYQMIPDFESLWFFAAY